MLRYDPRRRGPRARGRRLAHAAVARAWPLLALLVGACDLPTSLPTWDTQWQIPVRSTTLAVGQLLPATMTVTADRSAFQTSVAPITLGRTLGQMCSACTAPGVSGQTVPKPAFTTTLADTLRLPSEVAQATVAGGTVSVAISNGLGFDPIRPGATARGSLTLTLTSGGSTIGTLTLAGSTDALAPGSVTTRSVTLVGGVVGGKIAVNVTVNSPQGDAVRVDASQQFGVTVTPQTLRLADVTVSVSQKTVSIQPFDLSVQDIDQSLVDHVKAGTLLLIIDNPFAVTGAMTIRITGPNVSITKQVPLAAGSSTQTVPFSQDEIRSILGKPGVTFNASGPISATQPVKLTPAQSAAINAQLQLTLGPTEG